MNIQAAVKGSDQTAQAGLSLSDRTYHIVGNLMPQLGAQWLNGRVLDSRPRGHGFEPHQSHCVVSLSKTIIPSLVLVLSLSLYTARPSFEYYRQVYFVHSGLQDESLQVTISKLP